MTTIAATPALDVKDGDVVRFHPVTTHHDYVRVTVSGTPYELGSGDVVVRTIGLDGKMRIAWVGALTADAGEAKAPQKRSRRRSR